MRVAKFDQERIDNIKVIQKEQEEMRKNEQDRIKEYQQQLRTWRKEMKKANNEYAHSILNDIERRDVQIVNKIFHTEASKQIRGKTIKVTIEVKKE